MSFREHDKKTFIADTARDFAARRISKRDFLKKLGMAGLGLSAFSAGLLGNPRGFRRAGVHLLLDRIPAVAVPNDEHPDGSSQNSNIRNFDRQ